MNINNEVDLIRRKLKSENDFSSNPIDLNLNVIPPFNGGKEIKLIILGQDPTIKNVASRKNITHTLNLDKKNSLRAYINGICSELGITMENVYATNLFKYFYTLPPAETMQVLRSHLAPNLALLQLELERFKNIPVIALGEPVLRLLTHETAKVRVYWDYDPKTGVSNGDFKFSQANDNKLLRDFYPFPHQPSIRKVFYKNTFAKYLKFMKTSLM